MPGLGWLDVTDIPIYALLLLEPLHLNYLANCEPDEAMGTTMQAHPAIDWYFRQTHPPISDYIDQCLALANSVANAQEQRQAEFQVLDRMQDWLIYVLNPAKYDELEFLHWDDSSLLTMASFDNKIVLDIGSGTGRLALTVAAKAKVVYAIEPIANLRRYLCHKCEQLNLVNVFPLDGIIARIPLPDNFADILMAGHVFGELFNEEYMEMQRVVRNGGKILLHPGTNAVNDDHAHHFLIRNGFQFDTFEEPGDGLKRKYWKTINK